MTDEKVSSDATVMNTFSDLDRQFMAQALASAAEAADRGEVPVGACLVSASGELLASAGNGQIAACDPSAHAEINALRIGSQAVNNYRLPGTTLYVTLEPCMMCCGALIHARVSRLVFAAREPKAGAVVSTATLLDRSGLNHRTDWSEGLLAEESAALLRAFFAARR